MDRSKHTPTPWYAANWTCHAPRTVLVDDASVFLGKRVVAECDCDEDAAFIVRAVNSHDQLVEALRKIAENARAAIDGGDALEWIDELHEIASDVDKALAAASA